MSREARSLAIQDLAQHILPTMLGSMKEDDKEEKKQRPKKKLKKKVPEKRAPMPEPEEESEGVASISLFQLAGQSASEDKFKEQQKNAPKKPQKQQRVRGRR